MKEYIEPIVGIIILAWLLISPYYIKKAEKVNYFKAFLMSVAYLVMIGFCISVSIFIVMAILNKL